MRISSLCQSGTMATAKGPRHPMRNEMINKVTDHKGRTRLEVSKYWPDGTRFRRYAPNPTVAKNLDARICGAIATGTWKQLKEELSRTKEENNPTIDEFAEVYYREYCLVRNKRPDFKEHALKPIRKYFGKMRIKGLRRV